MNINNKNNLNQFKDLEPHEHKSAILIMSGDIISSWTGLRGMDKINVQFFCKQLCILFAAYFSQI